MGGWYGEDIGHVNSKLLIERGYGPMTPVPSPPSSASVPQAV